MYLLTSNFLVNVTMNKHKYIIGMPGDIALKK